MIIQVLAAAGIILSGYALLVGIRKRSHKYRPLCDLSKTVSCSKPFTGEFSRILFVPNAILGILFYAAIIWTAPLNSPLLVTIAALGMLATVVLAYISYYRLRVFCMVCTAVYLINVAIAVLTFKEAFMP